MPRIDKNLFRAVQATKEKQEKRTSPRKKGHKSPSVAKKDKASNKKEISYLRTRVREKFVCLQGTRQPKK